MHNVFMLYLKNNFVISIPGGNIPLERELDGLEHVILIPGGGDIQSHVGSTPSQLPFIHRLRKKGFFRFFGLFK